MSQTQKEITPVPDNTLSAADRYARILRNSRKSRLPAGFVEPKPPSFWPPENVALLEQYQQWLVDDDVGHTCIHLYYIPMAGHVLGYHLKPHDQLCLATDLEPALAYIRVKRAHPHWQKMCRLALERFRSFLLLERGQTPAPVRFKNPILPSITRDYPIGSSLT